MIEIPPPIQFYLRHQAQIEEWTALGKEVPKLASAFYEKLAGDLEARAAGLEGAPSVHTNFVAAYSKLFLYSSAWLDEVPRAAIGLEWQRSSSGFTGSYTGVWVRTDAPRGPALHASLKTRLEPVAGSRGLEPARTWWAAWRYEVPARDDYWNDLPAFGRHLVDVIAEWWTLFRPHVDAALEEVDAAREGRS